MLAFALSGVYAIADGFFVGNALGDKALAAINIAYPLTAFLQAAGTGLGMAGGIQYALCLGAGREEEKDRYWGNAAVLLAASGLALSVLLLVGAPPILQVFGASGEILTLARAYIRVIAYGAFFQVMGTGMVPFLRNMGSSMGAMLAMTAGFLTNIALDYLLVWRLPYGMAGAAAATVIGQAVTLAVCLLFFAAKKQRPRFQLAAYRVKRLLLVGLSPFGLAFSPNLVLILVNKSAALFGGDFAVTCYAPVSYISCVILLLLQGVSDGCQPLVSLCYAKGGERAAKQYRNLAYGFAAAVALACMAALYLFRGEMAALFGASGRVTAQVAQILPVFLSGYLFISFARITTAYFYATERNLYAYLLIYGEPLCLILLLLPLPAACGIMGTWAAVPASQLCVAVLSAAFLRKAARGRIARQ